MNNELSDEAYYAFSLLLLEESGIVLGETKQYLVKSRLFPLTRKHNIDSLDALINQVVRSRSSALSQAAIDAMTTNETLWFRDKYPFEILRNTLLPALAKRQQSLRIWSAASSSGQEPYSIAMTLMSFLNEHRSAFKGNVEIIATDISTEMLSICHQGHYNEMSLARGITPELRQRHFHVIDEQTMAINDDVKKLVTFKPFNLMGQFNALGKFDIVFCRNVLIYFSIEQKTRILQNISALLPDDGALLLGASESLSGAAACFKMQSQPQGLYYQKV